VTAPNIDALLDAHKDYLLAVMNARESWPGVRTDPRRERELTIAREALASARASLEATSKVDEEKLDALAEASKRAEDSLYTALCGYDVEELAETLEAKEAEIDELRKQLGLDPRVRS